MEQKKVIVGVNASYDSIAALLLLRLQNYELNAIHVLFSKDKESDSLIDHNSTYCLKHDDKKILEDIMAELSIPLYFIDMQECFNDTVITSGVMAKFMKEFHAPCLMCHKIKIAALSNKMQKLEADFIATGHYAKLRKGGQEGLVSLYQNSVKELDQHKLLAGVDQTLLSKLLLPLSDLTREKVVSIVKEHLPKYAPKLSLGANHPFCPVIKNPVAAIKKTIPPIMNKKSRLFLRDNKTFLNESYDNTEFEFGKVFKLGSSIRGKDQLLTVTGFNYSYQTIYVSEQPVKGVDYIFIQITEYLGKPHFHEPNHHLVSVNDSDEIFEAEVYIKALNYAVVFLKDKDMPYVPSKSILYIYEDTRQGRRLNYLAKVVSIGKVEGTSTTKPFNLAKQAGDYPF